MHVIYLRGFGLSTIVFSHNGDFTSVFLTLHFYPHFFKTKGECTPHLLSTPNGVNFYAKGQVYPYCFPLSTFTDMWTQVVRFSFNLQPPSSFLPWWLSWG